MRLKLYLKEAIDVGAITKDMVMSNWDRKSLKMVWVKVKQFDQAWKHDRQFYIGKGGSGNSIGQRYGGFLDILGMPEEERKQHLSRMEAKERKIATSTVSVSVDGKVYFDNGRHRFAVLRDLGAKKMPVAMSAESLKNAKEHKLTA